jgi:hypothetical protein
MRARNYSPNAAHCMPDATIRGGSSATRKRSPGLSELSFSQTIRPVRAAPRPKGTFRS